MIRDRSLNLTANEAFVLVSRFALDQEVLPKAKRSYGKIGSSLGLSRERMRQIEYKALCKLRELAFLSGGYGGSARFSEPARRVVL